MLYDLVGDPALLHATQKRLADTGVRVLDVELARMDPAHDARSFLPLLETAAALGARHIITQLPDPDHARAVERFAAGGLAGGASAVCGGARVSWVGGEASLGDRAGAGNRADEADRELGMS